MTRLTTISAALILPVGTAGTAYAQPIVVAANATAPGIPTVSATAGIGGAFGGIAATSLAIGAAALGITAAVVAGNDDTNSTTTTD